jgi:hypothetical protein
MLRVLWEDTEKHTVIEKCQIAVLSILFTTNSELRDQLTESDGMLVVHILYTINARIEKQILEVIETSIATEKSDVI